MPVLTQRQTRQSDKFYSPDSNPAVLLNCAVFIRNRQAHRSTIHHACGSVKCICRSPNTTRIPGSQQSAYTPPPIHSRCCTPHSGHIHLFKVSYSPQRRRRQTVSTPTSQHLPLGPSSASVMFLTKQSWDWGGRSPSIHAKITHLPTDPEGQSGRIRRHNSLPGWTDWLQASSCKPKGKTPKTDRLLLVFDWQPDSYQRPDRVS